MSQNVHFKTFHYETALEWQLSRRAQAMLPETEPIELSPPVDLGGEPGRWAPEQLLLSAVESCTLFTFLAEAQRQKLELVSWESTAEGTVGRGEDGRYGFTNVVVRPVVEVRTAEDAERARAAFAAIAHRCFIGNSLSAEPRIEPRIEVAGTVESAAELPADAVEGLTS